MTNLRAIKNSTQIDHDNHDLRRLKIMTNHENLRAINSMQIKNYDQS